MDEALYTDDLDLDAVRTLSQLAALLKEIRIRADKPSLRTLEARTRHSPKSLSKTTVGEMLRGERLPHKATMIAFLRACGMQDYDIEAWERAWGRVASAEEGQASRQVKSSWQFSDSRPVTLICPELPSAEKSRFADPADPNYTELLSYADLDSLVELYGHIRAENPAIDVSIRLSSKFKQKDLRDHVVLIGGIAWNTITERISGMSPLPIRQIKDPAVDTGEIFVVDSEGEERRFFPKWSDDDHELLEDVGLIARTPNPFNSNRSLTICNGIHSRGVLGAVRTLIDGSLRESNESYIKENFADASAFAILARVSVLKEETMTPDFRATNSILYQWSPSAGSVQP